MPDVVILGAGVMGSAMALPASHKGASVALVGTHLDRDIVDAVAAGKPHPRLKLALPAGVTAYPVEEFAAAMRESPRLLILGVASAGVDWAIDRLAETLTAPVPVLMITKGLAPTGDRIAVLPHRVAEEVRRRTGIALPVMAVGGPCIAGELAAARDTSVVVTGAEDDIRQALACLDAPFYHARVSADVMGVEICAAFKNFYALAVGAVAGLQEAKGAAPNGAQMFNLASSLFAQALREMAVLVTASGGTAASVYDLAGVGDLYVTCQAGRNSRMGRLLGLGLPYGRAKAEHMAADTVEGAQLALDLGPTLEAMMQAGTLPVDRLPLTRTILDAVCRDRPFTLDFARYHRA